MVDFDMAGNNFESIMSGNPKLSLQMSDGAKFLKAFSKNTPLAFPIV
jgi:hypothetical protein